MEEGSFDVAVLGAGIVGVSTAVHLQQRGLRVALVDRREPGEETSHGNAGIIQREAINPYLFPRNIGKLMQYALNSRPEAHYMRSSLKAVAPFLWRYFRSSNRAQARRTMQANIPLFAECLNAHGEVLEQAGSGDLVMRRGWIEIFRDGRAARANERELAQLREHDLDVVSLPASELALLEPHVELSRVAAAAHYRDAWTAKDPGALVKSHANLFERLGGEIVRADVRQAWRDGGGWHVGDLTAERIVVALGPWSKPFLDAFGVKLPMGIKRGYHRHYRPTGNRGLNRPVLDSANGFVLAPMARGIRLTTGAQFAELDAPAEPLQIEKTLPLARQLFALGETVDTSAWMGARPVFPDMLPVIGEAPGLPGAWLNFGHAHHGFTLGPATGKLLAQVMTGETPYCDPKPYSAHRFTG